MSPPTVSGLFEERRIRELFARYGGVGRIKTEADLERFITQIVERILRTRPIPRAAGILIGNGVPEGVVVSPVGTIFLRRDGATGTTLYVKETGTGNTGWVAK